MRPKLSRIPRLSALTMPSDMRWEWRELKEKTGQDTNFGYLFGICVEKNSELREDDPIEEVQIPSIVPGEPRC